MLSALFLSVSQAATMVATGSGNWSSTIPDAPWPGGIVPASTDNVTVNTPYNVTVDTTATVDYITGGGTVTMAANSTLNVTGNSGGTGVEVATLDATATGNTVNYQGNTYFTKYTTYYNLTWSGYGAPYITSSLTVLNDFTMSGSNGGQAGDGGVFVGHDLSVGPNCVWDVSCAPVSVANNTLISGILKIGCGSGNIASFKDVTVNAGGTFNLGDTIRSAISGNLTNNGTITGTGNASIHFTGTGQITGSSPVSPPTVSFEGTTTIGDTLNLAHTPKFLGTVVFDLANLQQVNCAGTLSFGNALSVINTGGTLATGSSYQLFSAPSYNAPNTFATINLPSLAPGLSWVTNLTTTGTISITDTAGGGSPVISLLNSGGSLTLSWDSTTYPGYTVQAQTNSASGGISGNWVNTGSGTPYTVPINPADPAVFFRLVHP
ncbi:MAG: hypothetical protein JWR69_4706 [Pedosphaera sp.]|nr:hypothetical protein [Pedosphaera sp.]